MKNTDAFGVKDASMFDKLNWHKRSKPYKEGNVPKWVTSQVSQSIHSSGHIQQGSLTFKIQRWLELKPDLYQLTLLVCRRRFHRNLDENWIILVKKVN